MKIENLVLSIDQMLRLKELGVEVKDTALAWVNARVGHNFVAPTDIIFHNDFIPTLTLQEIWCILPKEIEKDGDAYYLLMQDGHVQYSSWEAYSLDEILVNYGSEKPMETELDILYKMLCWCAESGYLNKE